MVIQRYFQTSSVKLKKRKKAQKRPRGRMIQFRQAATTFLLQEAQMWSEGFLADFYFNIAVVTELNRKYTDRQTCDIKVFPV